MRARAPGHPHPRRSQHPGRHLRRRVRRQPDRPAVVHRAHHSPSRRRGDSRTRRASRRRTARRRTHNTPRHRRRPHTRHPQHHRPTPHAAIDLRFAKRSRARSRTSQTSRSSVALRRRFVTCLRLSSPSASRASCLFCASLRVAAESPSMESRAPPSAAEAGYAGPLGSRTPPPARARPAGPAAGRDLPRLPWLRENARPRPAVSALCPRHAAAVRVQIASRRLPR